MYLIGISRLSQGERSLRIVWGFLPHAIVLQMMDTCLPSGFFRLQLFLFIGISLAALFSAVSVMPSLLQRTDTQYPYQGIHILGPDAEEYYAARVREVYDGYPWLGNVFFSESKDAPYFQPPLPEFTIATIGRLLGVDAISAFIGSKVILSFAAFLLLLSLLLLVTNSPLISIASTCAVLFGGALLSAPWDLPSFINSANHSFEFLRFSRAINPQWSASWFLVALIGLAGWIRFAPRRYLVLTTLATVILVYSYVYAWSYLFAVIGLLSLWYLIRRDWRRVFEIAAFWLIVIACSIPYVIHLSVLSRHPWYAETAERFGMVLRHGPLILGVWLSVFLGVSFASRRIWPWTWPLLPMISLAGLVAINQHVVTGQYIVPHHYHWYFIQPLGSAFAVAVLLTFLLPLLKPRLRIVFAGLIVLLSLWVAVTQQIRSYQAVASRWGAVQDAAPVLAYIQKTMRPGQSVFTLDEVVANQVPIYTGADVFFAQQSSNTLMSTDRGRFMYFFELWLSGLLPEQAQKEFSTDLRFTLSSRLHSIYYREAHGNFVALPDAEVDENVQLYREFFRSSMKDKLNRYPITAVITTPNDPSGHVWSTFLSCTKESFAAQGYTVRLMIPQGEVGSCL